MAQLWVPNSITMHIYITIYRLDHHQSSLVRFWCIIIPNCSAYLLWCFWFIWQWKCSTLFQPDFKAPIDPKAHIMQYLLSCQHATVPHTTIFICWLPPPMGIVMVNVDGSCSQTNDIAARGLIWDELGNWLIGFSANIGNGRATLVEIWGVYEGLKMAWHYGYSSVMVECNSVEVVKLFSEIVPHFHPHAMLITTCHQLIQNQWHCCINHIYREANICNARQSFLGSTNSIWGSA